MLFCLLDFHTLRFCCAACLLQSRILSLFNEVNSAPCVREIQSTSPDSLLTMQSLSAAASAAYCRSISARVIDRLRGCSPVFTNHSQPQGKAAASQCVIKYSHGSSTRCHQQSPAQSRQPPPASRV